MAFFVEAQSQGTGDADIVRLPSGRWLREPDFALVLGLRASSEYSGRERKWLRGANAAADTVSSVAAA